jgi:outer membrane biosynthesis protein TonB
MRSILAASLFLAPVLHAASAAALSPKADTPATTQVSQVSHGANSPATLDATTLHIASNEMYSMTASEEKVVLALKVDEKGNANVVRILQSANPDLDSRVVAAVSRSYFHPAKLDNHVVPSDLNLVVVLQR